MREFWNLYYDGKDCVCCKPVVRKTERTAKAYARGVSETKNRIVDILNDERSRWGSGTLANNLIKQLTERIESGN